MTDVKNWNWPCFVAKSVGLRFTLFCCDLRAFCLEKNFSQKCAMWRKWSDIIYKGASLGHQYLVSFTPKSKSSKIWYFTRQWLSTSPVSRDNTRISFSPFVCLLHPAPALRRPVGPKPTARCRSGQPFAMLLTHPCPVKNVAFPSSAVVKANLSEAFWGTWWGKIFCEKALNWFHIKRFESIFLTKQTCSSTQSPIPCLSSILNQWQSLWAVIPWKWFFTAVWLLEVNNDK